VKNLHVVAHVNQDDASAPRERDITLLYKVEPGVFTFFSTVGTFFFETSGSKAFQTKASVSMLRSWRTFQKTWSKLVPLGVIL